MGTKKPLEKVARYVYLHRVKRSALSDANFFKNIAEALTVVHLVRHYGSRCCVITPYDAQRETIQRLLRLQEDGLPWDIVFNVDSFQGVFGYLSPSLPKLTSKSRQRS